MKRLLLLLLLLPVMGQDCETPPPEPPPNRSPYCYGTPSTVKQVKDGVAAAYSAIFGGEESTDRRATLRMGFPNSRCTGVAVGPHRALTAAHCTHGQDSTTAALSGYGEPPYWDATGWTEHPDYLLYLYSGNIDLERRKSDISVVRFDKARTGEDGLPEDYVPDIFDPLDPADASQCVRFIAQGWGKWEGDALSLRECEYDIDQVTERQVISHHGPDECRICFGDSGGPLYAEMSDGSLKLVGLTSTTNNQECSIASAHVRLSTHKDWLEKQVQE
jgi:hypothetical protein